MSTKLPGYEQTVICPYNKSHVILKQRIQTHLIKCAKQHPDIKLETCPFDITHKIPFEELDAHKKDCPSRDSFDRYMYRVSNQSSSQSTAAPSRPAQPPPKKPKHDDDSDDDWD